MEKIIVKNFLILKDVEMSINKFNLLIGEQASGKSLLAKLVFFFKDSLELLAKTVVNGRDFDDYKLELQKQFLLNFPRDYWQQEQDFEISYHIDNQVMIVKYDDKQPSKITILLPESFEELFSSSKNFIQTNKENRHFFTAHALQDFLLYQLKEKQIQNFFVRQLFIPAGRSFFANLQKNFWALNTHTLDIDPLLKKFGQAYDATKMMYQMATDLGEDIRLYNVHPQFKAVVKAEYQEINGEDWLVNDKQKIRLSRASSGQQEAFPLMFLLLLNGADYQQYYANIFIEEPEAHLFPMAQANVLSAMLKNYHEQQTRFFITTHSPYILTALNNSVYASELIQQGKLTEEKFFELSNSYPINFDDISAFSIENGRLSDIKDDELKLIGGEILDSVSHQFGAVYDTLLDLDN